MKSNFLKIIVLLITSLATQFTFAQYDEENYAPISSPVAPIPSVPIRNTGNFKQLTVKHRFSAPIGELKKESPFATFASKESPSDIDIIEAAKKIFNKFPYHNIIDEPENISEAELRKKTDANWEMIKKDFPTYTEKEIADNMETIEEYYAKNFDHELMKQITLNKQNLRSGKSLNQLQRSGKALSCDFIEVIKKARFKAAIGSVAILIASDVAVNSSEARFAGDGEGNNDRQDAYRHILLNALLANLYPTISSRKRAIQFARKVTDAREICGNNPVDSREMDFHNNAIGREIWRNITGSRKTKILKITYGLKRKSRATIKNIVYDYVNDRSCFIVKFANKNAFPNNLLAKNKTVNEIYQKIRETDANTAVYFQGTIAKGKPLAEKQYDFSGCTDADLPPTELPKPTNWVFEIAEIPFFSPPTLPAPSPISPFLDCWEYIKGGSNQFGSITFPHYKKKPCPCVRVITTTTPCFKL